MLAVSFTRFSLLPLAQIAGAWWIAGAIILVLGAMSWWLATRRKSCTVLKKATAQREGKTYVKRVYVERPGLTAKLWFEANPDSVSAFVVGHRGDDDSFTVKMGGSEPTHIAEARDALLDVGLELDKCSWTDIVNKAQ
jgi:hypothetical protein